MASSLFPSQTPNNGNNIINVINNIKSAAQGNPEALFQRMMQTNPQFRTFAESMKGKTPEQAFKEYGLDYDQIRGLFG